MGRASGNQAAAREAFRQAGEVLGDVIGQTLTLVDGLVVIGGGLSGSWPLFMPALMEELNGQYTGSRATPLPGWRSAAFNLEDPVQAREHSLRSEGRRNHPSQPPCERVQYDPLRRVGVGLSRLGTSQAVASGAYAFALSKLNEISE